VCCRKEWKCVSLLVASTAIPRLNTALLILALTLLCRSVDLPELPRRWTVTFLETHAVSDCQSGLITVSEKFEI
jgi:hypothetical protein